MSNNYAKLGVAIKDSLDDEGGQVESDVVREGHARSDEGSSVLV